ncbi:uncharacterized protein isoform X2 [Rhodnius prolixus]|uniref:uncharacterized protein isoform X2 n=1 Tax=Rhodnius prolixus TaxID=13249 RepID=UPI003D18D28D
MPLMNQQCKVCNEPAAGFHFGAFTCEGCKSFFGRTYNNLSSISECKNNGECVINKKNRTSCKACRLRKCLLVGMSKSGSRYGRRSNWFKIHCLLQEQASSVVQQHHHHHQQQHNQHHHQQQPCSSPNMLKKEDSLDECQRDKDYRYNSPSSPALTTSPPVLSGPPAVPPPSNLYTPYHLTSAQHSIATPPLTPALSVASVVSHLSPLQQTAPALTVLPTHPVLVSLASLPDPWPRPIASPPVREAPQDQPIDLSVRSKQEQVLDLTAKKLKT